MRAYSAAASRLIVSPRFSAARARSGPSASRALRSGPSRRRTSDGTSAEIDALLAAPGRDSWLARRDHALLLVAVQTGLRVSELTGLTTSDVHLGPGAHVRCHGKGRKDRATPLTRQTITVLRAWLAERGGGPGDPLFPARAGRRLSRDAVERLVAKHAAAAPRLPSSRQERHPALAQALSRDGPTSYAAWTPRHRAMDGTRRSRLHPGQHADMTIKEKALARVQPRGTQPGRYRAPDTLLAFLDTLSPRPPIPDYAAPGAGTTPLTSTLTSRSA